MRFTDKEKNQLSFKEQVNQAFDDFEETIRKIFSKAKNSD